MLSSRVRQLWTVLIETTVGPTVMAPFPLRAVTSYLTTAGAFTLLLPRKVSFDVPSRLLVRRKQCELA